MLRRLSFQHRIQPKVHAGGVFARAEEPHATMINSFRRLHPVIVPLPILALVCVLGTDIAYSLTRDLFWARASLWLLIIGLCSGAVAALSGAADFFRSPSAGGSVAGFVHVLASAATVLTALGNFAVRFHNPKLISMPWDEILSAASVACIVLALLAGTKVSYRDKIVAGTDE